MENETAVRHLLDLCRKNDRTGIWQYSGFLTPAEQDDFLRCPEAARFSFRMAGGHEAAERRILAVGDEEISGEPDLPIRVVEIRAKSEKYAEELTHRDYLGAILGLGIERSLTGDILIRDHRAWVFCLASAAELLTDSLTQVRRTAVTAEIASSDLPELAPRFEPIRLNIASERLDAVCAAFAGLSRGQAEKLFSAEKVFVNGRIIADKSTRLKAGDILSVRGFGKAVYDGIEHETRKNRIWIMLRKYL